MSISQEEGACDSAFETDHQAVAREAAIKVLKDFDASSELRDVNREAAIALFDPEEVLVKDTIYNGFFCTIATLRGISLQPSNFEDSIEEHRERCAGRSHDGHYALKYISPESVKQDEETARIAGATLMIEAKMLMNLAPHPHICQLYGLNASGPDAAFGSKIPQDGFFLVIDSIAETLPQRMAAWREKKCYYEGERFDDLKTRQSQLTQRLEVALDICSPMVFLSKRKIVYCFHPEKCGFDSRYKRIKLFHFGQARESGKDPYATFIDEDMRYRAYLAPEIFTAGQTTVTCDVDVYAFGMLLWETLTLKHPLEGMSNVSHITQVVNGRTRPPINKTWPENIRKLIESCWTATDRPTMKDVYDSLENFLLFQQDFEGIDRTEDHSGMAPQAESPRRKIKYERAGDTITEERDKDSKSVRSRESVQSRGTKASVASDRSRGSAESKTERRPRRKSADQVPVEESAHQVIQEDNNTQRPSRRSDVERSKPVEKDGCQRQRSSRELSRDRVERPEDNIGESSLPKMAEPDEKPAEEAAAPKSQFCVKDKNGKIRRRRSSSAFNRIGNDDDDQSGGRRSTSSRLLSVKDKDGKIKRTAVKPDISNDDNESTARKSVGSSESSSQSQRRRPSKRVSKRNVFDTLEVLCKDGDVPTPDTCSLAVGGDGADGPVRGVRRSKSGPSHTGVSTDVCDASNDDQSSRRRSTSSRLLSVKDKDGKIKRTAVKADISNDDNESTARKSVGSSESKSLSQRRRSSKRVSKRNALDTLEVLCKNGDVPTPDTCSLAVGGDEADGPVRGVRRSKSGPSHTGVSTDVCETSNLRRGGRRPNAESNGKDEGDGPVSRRGAARSRSSDGRILNHQGSSRRVASSENNDTGESGGRMASSRRGVSRSRSSKETLAKQSSSRRVVTAENNDNDESGGRVAAALSRRSKASDDGAPNQPPTRRSTSRQKSLTCAITSPKAPATGGNGRRRSPVGCTTHLAASSVLEAPSPRGVRRSVSSGNEMLGMTAWLARTPMEEPKRRGGSRNFGASSQDFGFSERQNRKISQEKTFSLSMSEHSNWFDLAGADKKQDEKDPAANPFGNKTEKLRSSENDTKGAIRKRIIEKAKEMAKEKEERERAAHGLPISQDFQRRRVQVVATAAAATVSGPGLFRQRSKRQVKRV